MILMKRAGSSSKRTQKISQIYHCLTNLNNEHNKRFFFVHTSFCEVSFERLENMVKIKKK